MTTVCSPSIQRTAGRSITTRSGADTVKTLKATGSERSRVSRVNAPCWSIRAPVSEVVVCALDATAATSIAAKAAIASPRRHISLSLRTLPASRSVLYRQ